MRGGDALLSSVREVIDRVLSTGSRTQEASPVNTLPQAPIRPRSQTFPHLIQASHPPPDLRLAGILPPLAHRPIITTHLPVHRPISTPRLLVLQAKINGSRPLALLLAIMDNQGIRDLVPLMLVSRVQT